MYCHPDEVGNAKREYVEQASFPEVAKHLWQPRWLKWAVAMTRKGGLVREGISTARGLTEDVANKLPGAPKAIFSRRHTSGHCAYVVDGVLVSGDALITGHPVSTRRGPQLLPAVFNHDHNDCAPPGHTGQAGHEVLLPGHGPLWRGPIRDAAERAQR